MPIPRNKLHHPKTTSDSREAADPRPPTSAPKEPLQRRRPGKRNPSSTGCTGRGRSRQKRNNPPEPCSRSRRRHAPVKSLTKCVRASKRGRFHPIYKKRVSGDADDIGVRRYAGLPIPGGRVANPTEYVPFQVYEPHTARDESERFESSTGATQPAPPAHI